MTSTLRLLSSLPLLVAALAHSGCGDDATADSPTLPATDAAADATDATSADTSQDVGADTPADTSTPDVHDAAPDAFEDASDAPAETTADAAPDAPANWHWQSGPALPSPRQSAASAVVNGKLYLFGGMELTGTSGGTIDTSVVFDPATQTWETRAPLPEAACCMASAAVGGKVYLAGGYEQDGSPSARLWVYDVAANSWSTQTSMPTARAIAAGFLWEGKVGVVGGRVSTTSPTGIIELFDPAQNTWEAGLSTMPTARETPAAIATSTRLVVAGGYPEMSMYGTDLVEVYDGTWTTGPNMLLPRGQLAFGLLPQGMVLAGGWGPAGHTAASELWDLTSDHWDALPDMPTARAGACGGVLGGSFYVVGGGAYGGGGWTSLTTVEVLLP